MFYIDEVNLKKILLENYQINEYELFIDFLKRFLNILIDKENFKTDIENLYSTICNGFKKTCMNNKIGLLSIEGCVGIGKSLLCSSLKKIIPDDIYILDEPLSIWQNIYNSIKSHNILELFYIAIGSTAESKMPFYFQSLVIFTRWMVLTFKSLDYDYFISERSVFSDRFS